MPRHAPFNVCGSIRSCMCTTESGQQNCSFAYDTDFDSLDTGSDTIRLGKQCSYFELVETGSESPSAESGCRSLEIWRCSVDSGSIKSPTRCLFFGASNSWNPEVSHIVHKASPQLQAYQLFQPISYYGRHGRKIQVINTAESFTVCILRRDSSRPAFRLRCQTC